MLRLNVGALLRTTTSIRTSSVSNSSSMTRTLTDCSPLDQFHWVQQPSFNHVDEPRRDSTSKRQSTSPPSMSKLSVALSRRSRRCTCSCQR